jgi:hypothetical protein
VYRSTGERDLFVELYNRCNGRSEVSGRSLVPPNHSRFHAQGSHLLPKGTHPELRLNPSNIVMVTLDEHNAWHNTGDKRKLIERDERWTWIVERYEQLKRTHP